MKPGKNFKISLEELSSRGRKIIEQRLRNLLIGSFETSPTIKSEFQSREVIKE